LKNILIFTFVLFAWFAVFANSVRDIERQIQDHRSRSDSLQNLISQSERRISELARRENEQLAQLNEMEKAIEASRALISAVEKQIDSVSLQKAQTEKQLLQTQKMLDARREIMAARLQSIYKMGEPTMLSIILGASSPEEVVMRIRYMQDLNRYDRTLLDTIRQDEQKLQAENEILLAKNAHLATLLRERQKEGEKAREQAAARRRFVSQLRSERDRWETSMSEFKSAQAELSAVIEDLIVEMSKPTIEEMSNFAEKKGKLPWAVQGKIIANFGRIVHPEYKTAIMNNGISIEAPNGTPVKAVAAGVVEFVGRMRGYGKLMIINHFGGYLTIYAHLNENFLEKGARVRAEQVIGSVGESGSLDGNKLHFEIRHENNALNPMEWLVKR